MTYVNPPRESPKNIFHGIFYSHVLNHEIGYNIYLPPDYTEGKQRYPIVYHIHGWQGNESSDIWRMERAYRNRQAITVFINAISSECEYFNALWQIESMFIKELIPHVDEKYRTNKSKMLSGFSMGGAMAFYYAVKYSEIFCSVTPYAGTYHHQYRDYQGVGEPPEMAIVLYEKMMTEKRYLEENNILYMVRQNADKIRGNLYIDIRIGINDILFCENEIMHLYLNSLNIPHEYKKFVNVGHELDKLL